MSTDLESFAIIPGILALGVALGVAWGRFSERLAIPELLRMLSTPLFTGALGLVFGFPLALIVFGDKIRNSPHEGAIAATAVTLGASSRLPVKRSAFYAEARQRSGHNAGRSRAMPSLKNAMVAFTRGTARTSP